MHNSYVNKRLKRENKYNERKRKYHKILENISLQTKNTNKV